MKIETKKIEIEKIRVHVKNSNRMSKEYLKTLKRHIKKSGVYPPLIVRAVGRDCYEMLDGHHRLRVLLELGHDEARCEVWDVDDAGALMLLATLNRLSGSDDPVLRAELLEEIGKGSDLDAISKYLPEQKKDLERLERLLEPLPDIAKAEMLSDLPEAFHFFLLPRQIKVLRKKLREVEGCNEASLFELLNITY